jgi:hypothetical protein
LQPNFYSRWPVSCSTIRNSFVSIRKTMAAKTAVKIPMVSQKPKTSLRFADQF